MAKGVLRRQQRQDQDALEEMQQQRQPRALTLPQAATGFEPQERQEQKKPGFEAQAVAQRQGALGGKAKTEGKAIGPGAM